MEKVFGDYLVKYKKETPVETRPQTMGTDLDHPSILDIQTCYSRIPIEDSLMSSDCPYIALLFTAEYAPPCATFLTQFTAFVNEANKDPAHKRFDIVVVNCDRNESDFKTHIAKMPLAWYNVPFEATKVMEQLEDIACAASIPKVTILKPSASLSEPFLKDIKASILKNQNMDTAVKEVMEKLHKK